MAPHTVQAASAKDGSVYGKVFSSLFHGSLLGKADAQLVFVLLIAHADPEGGVEAHPAEMATWTGMSLERVNAALEVVLAPDPDSRSPEEDGRRVLRNGLTEWQIVNYLKYRSIRDEDERRVQNRRAQAKRRQPMSASVSRGQPPSAHGEGEVEGEEEEEKTTHLPETSSGGGGPTGRIKPRNHEPPGFIEFYRPYPRHENRDEAVVQYKAARRRHVDMDAEDFAYAAKEYALEVARIGVPWDKIPYPERWLKRGGFNKYFAEEDLNAAREEDRIADGNV